VEGVKGCGWVWGAEGGGVDARALQSTEALREPSQDLPRSISSMFTLRFMMRGGISTPYTLFRTLQSIQDLAADGAKLAALGVAHGDMLFMLYR
jgi:hypothetical protein